MNIEYMKRYNRGSYIFVECELCGQRFNAGRGGNAPGIRWCNALCNDWWARHTRQESPEVVKVAEKVEPCAELPATKAKIARGRGSDANDS